MDLRNQCDAAVRLGDLVDDKSFLAEFLANFDDDWSHRQDLLPTQVPLPPPSLAFAIPALVSDYPSWWPTNLG